MIGETELDAKEPTWPEPLGLVWVMGTAEAVPIGLRRALKHRACVHRGPEPPVGEAPSAVVWCPEGEEAREVATGVRRLRALAPDAAVLVLGPSLRHVGLAREAMRAGARGFLHAGMSPQQIARAISVAANEGEFALPRGLLEWLIAEERGAEPSDLSPRQREVLELAAEGLSNAEIAKRLFLTESTVKQHLTAAYKTLGARNRRQATNILWHSSSFGAIGRFVIRRQLCFNNPAKGY